MVVGVKFKLSYPSCKHRAVRRGICAGFFAQFDPSKELGACPPLGYRDPFGHLVAGPGISKEFPLTKTGCALPVMRMLVYKAHKPVRYIYHKHP